MSIKITDIAEVIFHSMSEKYKGKSKFPGFFGVKNESGLFDLFVVEGAKDQFSAGMPKRGDKSEVNERDFSKELIMKSLSFVQQMAFKGFSFSGKAKEINKAYEDITNAICFFAKKRLSPGEAFVITPIKGVSILFITEGMNIRGVISGGDLIAQISKGLEENGIADEIDAENISLEDINKLM